MEILAPAGSLPAMKSAVFSGADAVYFGGGDFNARIRAKNFTEEEIASGVRFCRERGVKCYAAMNTLVTDRELPQAMRLASFFAECGVDAFIVQDTGLASLLKRATQIPLHASTQMTVHTLDGILALAEAGFSRVVLSRELSQADLRYILMHAPCEIEVFVHGALCMCYSGQCYMSSLIGNRSGNRGACAQPCRLPYQDGYSLSLKDLCLLKYVKDLEQMGVSSLKIEGRMKSPEYVAAVTEAYARVRDGKPYSSTDEELLAKIFSRGGFTDGYYQAKKGKAMFGIRSETTAKIPLPHKEYKRLSLSVSAVARGETLFVTYTSSDGYSAQEELFLQPAKTLSLDRERIREALGRVGDSFYTVREIRIDIPDDMFVAVSALNRARRACIERLSSMRLISGSGFQLPAMSSGSGEKPKNQTLRAVFLNPASLPEDVSALETVWLPLSFAASKKAPVMLEKLGRKAGCFLPRIFFDRETPEILDFVRSARERGVEKFLCGNIGQIRLLQQEGVEIHGDFGLNVFNSAAAEFYEEAGLASQVLSFELNAAQLRALRGENRGMIAYGRLPFMVTENCVKKQHHKPEGLTDRIGKTFLVTCEYGCRNAVWNSDPLYLADRDLSDAAFLQLIFTDETPRTAAQILSEYAGGTPCFREGMTRAHF